MLSDEERQAIKILKINPEIIADLDEEMFEKMCEFKEKSIKELKYWASQTILNLIKKQQKEIEELKSQIDEHVYYDLGGRSCGKTELLRHYKKGYDMNNKFWKDKIKAKIEELENEKEKYFEKQVIQHEIEILHSLLEKE